jgi:tRNA threonylcarbamoyladenosine biosynthesis protein TsaB
VHVLAIDSAFGPFSAALAARGQIVAERASNPGETAAEHLPPLVQSVLNESGVTFAQIDRLTVTIGPGGFTSLRAGLAFAKGLALAVDRPLLGFSTLEALAATVTGESDGEHAVASIVDARRGEVFLQVFATGLAPVGDPCVTTPTSFAAHWPAQIRSCALCGSGAQSILSALEQLGVAYSMTGVIAPRAGALALLAARIEPASRPARALYLRPADARPSA